MAGPQIESRSPDGDAARRHFSFEASDNFVAVLDEIRGSLLISSYQAGRLVAVGVYQGRLNVTLHAFEGAMGIAVADDRIAVAAGPQIWFLQNTPNIAPQLEPAGKFDSCFVTRSSHVTGEIH